MSESMCFYSSLITHHSSLIKKAIYIFIRDLGEERGVRRLFLARLTYDLLKNRSQLCRSLLNAQFDEAEARTVVEDNDQQQAADDADKDALALAFVREGRKLFLSDELRHAGR